MLRIKLSFFIFFIFTLVVGKLISFSTFLNCTLHLVILIIPSKLLSHFSSQNNSNRFSSKSFLTRKVVVVGVNRGVGNLNLFKVTREWGMNFYRNPYSPPWFIVSFNVVLCFMLSNIMHDLCHVAWFVACCLIFIWFDFFIFIFHKIKWN